ncbi:hydroxyacid dehydrogenase [Aerococcaceae bacterium DSM 111022]|nr:hydroxyacid dehydrogenase [Aerococcaceae bacterium DSM 111022]
MRVALIEPLRVPDSYIEDLGKSITDLGHEFVYYNEKTTDTEELYERSKDVEIVIIANNPYPAEVINRLEKTKLINVAFTGVDHVDQKVAADKGIQIANASGYSNTAVPELAIGLVLSLYRDIVQGDADTRKGEDFTAPFQGREIKGKTVGIVGTGNLGIKTAELFKAFGANLIGYNRSEKEEAKELGLEYKSLEEVMSESDIISIHLPNTDATKGIISRELMESMKDDALLINVARGPIVDNEALAELLNNGAIGGAGIDVYDMEPPLPNDYPLIHTKKSVLTPHIAYLTDEAMVDRANIVFDNAVKYLEGKPQNIVEL